MKIIKFALVIFNLIFNVCILFSQDIVNPYILRDNSPLNDVQLLAPTEPISGFVHDTRIPEVSSSSGYDGEYMISLKFHPWHGSSTSSTSSYYGFQNYLKTYSIEVVSYPFMMNCFDEPNGCATNSNPQSNRTLVMPDDNHIYTGTAWGNLSQFHNNGTFRFSDGMSSQDQGECPDRLVSFQFKSDGSVLTTGCTTTLPHTILKHTVYFHCFGPNGDQIVSSFSWLYDNTRGIMRSYPFYDNNSSTGISDGLHDVMFVPMIIQDNTFLDPNNTGLLVNRYDRSDNYNNNGGIIKGGTINYFPFDDITGCSTFPIPNYSQDEFSVQDLLTSPFPYFDYYNTKPFPSSYLLMNNFLRKADGTILAGYGENGNVIEPLILPNNRLSHSYFINTDFDGLNDRIVHMNILNPIEKVIYNPSEVTLDPDAGDQSLNNPPINIIFPTGYTFKTVLGRYPSVQEVTDANTDLQNGGPYSDLRNVPVPVNAADLAPAPDPVNYPEVMWDDPASPLVNGFYDDERFGYYYIQEKATLTIEPCVRLFDARIAVYPGGTLRFEQQPGILGYEDTDMNQGRYKIRGEGGAILRNYNPIQYIQNGQIYQSIPLNYIATDEIFSGNNVDIDSDQPDGNYSILAGADVTFTAGDFIKLVDGFSVQGGDFHAVINTNIPVLSNCNILNGNTGGNRVASSETDISMKKNVFAITCSPNPNTGKWVVSSTTDAKITSIKVTNAIGQEVYFKGNLSSQSELIDMGSLHKGLLFVTVNSTKGESDVVKVVVE